MAGTVTVYLGTLLPTLIARWSLTDAQAGALLTAQFAGSLAGSLSQGSIASRWGAHRSVAIGYLLMALGTAAVAGGGKSSVMAAFCCAGLGIGWSVPASNWLAAQYSPRSEQTRAINILNAAWCVGAVVGPVLLARGIAWIGFAPALLALSAVLAGAAAWTYLLTSVDVREAREASTASSRRRVRNLALGTAAMLFSYCGLESGISGWTPALAARELNLNNADAALALSAFWGSVLVIRVLVSFTRLSRWIGLRSLLACLTSTGVGVLLMTAPRNRIALGLGVMLAGLGCATVFPTIVSLFQIRAGAGSESWMGYVVAAGSLGSTTIPWLIGASSGWFGGLRWSMLVLVVASLAGVSAFLRVLRRPSAAPPAPS
jgi:fucose permease